MKLNKFLIWGLVSMMGILTCCTTQNNDNKEETKIKVSIERELKEYDKYNVEAYLQPIWNSREIYNETGMFVGPEDKVPLLYNPSEIISVRNYGLDVEYVKDVDWVLEDGKIKRTTNSSIPYMEINEYYCKTPSGTQLDLDKSKVKDYSIPGTRYLKYGEGDTFTKYMIAVTYKHNEEWKGPEVVDKHERFSNFLNKLSTGNAKILFCGDSIATGCNASGTPKGGNILPGCEMWPKLVTQKIKDIKNCELEYINTAVGGTASSWFLTNFEENVLQYNPDLLIIHNGVNDRNTSVLQYDQRFSSVIRQFHENCPNGEILFVGSILANPECSNFYKNQEQFVDVYKKFESEYDFVSVVPSVTEFHQYFLSVGKRYRDTTGNNVNHPNDFLVRVYAQVILKTLLGDDFWKEEYVELQV